MVTEIDVISLNEPKEIFPAYQEALESLTPKTTLIIENGAFYNDK